MFRHSSSASLQLDSEFVCLEGFTEDSVSTALSGHVVLDLAEATPVTTIMVDFRGSAAIPMNTYEFGAYVRTSQSHNICTQEWTVADYSSDGHRYLCPGQHSFAFNLRLGGSLPASTIASTSVTPSVSYKLSATISCAGTVRSIRAHAPVTIIRSFSSYALEFQQSLEVEDAKGGDVYVKLSLPHKAWAAGETLVCSFHASALDKSAVVRSVELSIVETCGMFRPGG
ncbi:hypothetical protein K488DRAFT_56071, partial [Vararia minispora EC-137]